MTKEDRQKIVAISEEAARLLRENPDWTYKKAIEKAKEEKKYGAFKENRTS